MRILVIGVTGKVGKPLVQYLIRRGADVRILMRTPDRAALAPPPASVVVADIPGDPKSAHEAFEGWTPSSCSIARR
jgi:uncharacterized protein YbjT (DUF2867 family)